MRQQDLEMIKYILFLIVAFGIAVSLSSREASMEGEAKDIHQRRRVVIDDAVVNEVTIINGRNNNRPILRFPPNVSLNVEKKDLKLENSKISTYSAEVYLSFDRDVKKIVALNNSVNPFFRNVIVRYSAALSKNNLSDDERIKEIIKNSEKSIYLREIGLVEYVPKDIAGGVRYHYYIPMRPFEIKINHDYFYIGCEDNSITKSVVGYCWVNFRLNQKISIVYKFNVDMLPDWKSLHREVEDFSNSLIK